METDDSTKNKKILDTVQKKTATTTTTTDDTTKSKLTAKKAGITGKKATTTKKLPGEVKKSRSKLTPAHKKYLKTLITRTPTLYNTTLRDKLLNKFTDIDSIDPTTIGRFLKNELGLERRRIRMTEKEMKYFEKHGIIPR
ncbi:hypothetical protein BD770DRAFT_474768, partial [Pilaira anomala]